MAKILALDTSTDACSVALLLDGEVREDFRVVPRQHTQLLLPMVSDLLAGAGLKVADLDAIAFGRGPGSFAGIRIATGTAQGLAFAAGLPLLPISTLAAMALQAHQQQGAGRVTAALDARMDEIYACAYRFDNGLPVELMAERVCSPAELTLPEGNWQAVGKGWHYLESMSDAVRGSLAGVEQELYPSAAAMLPIALADWQAGRAVAADQAMPVYLRDEVAWKKKDQQ
ncbi:tRNA (adenosine(37)-N6)-threonylcarbamoyltransferase complex dimerization subunit type 1 TsaB [Marinobacterium arenosum]|uniref:tRNA (adenosine(37)-N6)-threonylcarbamoyltransferase complex dimerization subunit type 1 TsaB n=1 Tax=Marinobacterium arenosum TaxID=2862496 RepID=UPI001C9756CD|nr:tRNA (adenosine(37)-N6)-threonylcarbamoyltransferase complex dimerization subunit type 1 TsaB [Marinobacterium arenosum]MBY4678999.1 tRNA (adenosine(37)-N6)-threonylcarbamoyltransferase complex dimerization subunit type 1 TsaB [Marinobacterium arenosum]